MRPLRRWFLPAPSNVVGLLVAQGRVTVEGMEAFERWADGQPGTVDLVRELEHRADDARKAVQREVRTAFVSEVSPENAFDLSQRLDEIINAAKNLAREADVLDMPPDPPIREMAHLAAEGVRSLVRAIGKLGARVPPGHVRPARGRRSPRGDGAEGALPALRAHGRPYQRRRRPHLVRGGQGGLTVRIKLAVW
jgi:hypothetical protein